MRLTYAAQARADLDAIADYLDAKSPVGAKRVAFSVRRCIERLVQHPLSGRPQTKPGVRKIVEPKYGYLIYYAVAPGNDEIVVLAVRHPARERNYKDG